MSGNSARRRMMKFMPADFRLVEARQPPLKDQYDEWLARVICYAFSVPASAFVSQVNRATSETLRLQATQEGLVPLKAWIKGALDQVIQVYLAAPDLEFIWVGDDAVDPLQQAQTLNILVGAGIKTREEARADLGLAPEGGKDSGLGKYNHNHDERGRFATADDAVGPGDRPQLKAPPNGVQVASLKPMPPIASRASAPIQIIYPGDYHDLVLKQELEDYMKAGARCVSEVRLQLGDVTAHLDALCVGASGILMGVDVKTGLDPGFTPEQAIVYPHAMAGAGVTSPDSKINLLGLPPDTPLPPFPIFIVYVPGPGELKRFFELKPEPLDKLY